MPDIVGARAQEPSVHLFPQLEGDMFLILLRGALHNLGVLVVGIGWAYLGTRVDALLGLHEFSSVPARIAAVVLLVLGFLTRLWATAHFYSRRMRVISLEPQGSLITSGPFSLSRNPLYLGGNVFTFFGASLLLGSPAALAMTALHLLLVDWMIRREERQLEARFGDEFRSYRARVRRWI